MVPGAFKFIEANILVKSVPALGVQALRSCLKETAPLNIELKDVTLETFQELMFWSNILAFNKVLAIDVTFEVFNPLIS